MNQLWMEIAFEMGCSDVECKRKWAILRNCYARTLREERNQKTKRKPWYLQKSLSFLKKHIHPHQKQKNDPSDDYLPDHFSPQSNFCIDIDSSEDPSKMNQTLLANLARYSAEMLQSPPPMGDSKDYKDIALLNHDQFAQTAVDCKDFAATDTAMINQNPASNLPTDEVSNFSTVTIKSSPKAKEDRPTDVTEEMTYNQAANSNQLFLTSLLPDLNKLSEKKQRVFKRKTIELLEFLFEADENLIASSSVYK